MVNISLFNSLLYTIGWFWCVSWGAKNYPLAALLGGTFLIAIQLINIAFASRSALKKDVLLLLPSLALGAFMELFFLQSGTIVYAHSSSALPPLWILILYPLFALVLNHSLNFLQKSYLLSFLFGFAFAPLSYIAGGQMGAATLRYSLLLTWIIIGISWGIFLVVVTWVSKRTE